MTREMAETYRRRFGLDRDPDWPEAEYRALQPLLERRSIRKYRDEPVSDALLDLLLACAQSAPAKSDLQQYSIIVIRERQRIDQLGGLVPSNDWIKGAAAMLVFCGDLKRARHVCRLQGREHLNDNLDSYTNTVTDAAIALATFMRAAETVGLGCCPLSVVRNEIDAASAILGLPEGVYPLAALGLGWPDETPGISMRLPPRVVIHRECYDSEGLDAALNDYGERRHSVQPIPDAKQRHPQLFGLSEHCTWTENLSRQLSRPERPDLRAFLRRRGFALD